ncbi:hypothetical protein CGZ80_01150 [Rhodopirellula sp. MGV]|nr:hypothetical protein CGZ80_01150 [Rhodopirellula sp. MGV]PNY37665.1 ThuA domain-containing protein [Rhodopirellula baltica]
MLAVAALCLIGITVSGKAIAQSDDSPSFKVIAFYTGTSDQAHISFVAEAKEWFAKMAKQHHFKFEHTNDWSRLTNDELSNRDLVVFWDTRPESPEQRKAFEEYMKSGGAWIGFHFAAFALTPSAYPQDWDWYHNEFLGSGQYVSNTWRPTSAVLRVENSDHPVTKDLPETFDSSPNEWYRWELPLRENADIKVLVSIDPKSFPLGTGPKPHEIWHSGDYPVVWTNTRYRMLYLNMGHNDIDYANNSKRDLSHTFGNEHQDRLLINAIELFKKSSSQ